MEGSYSHAGRPRGNKPSARMTHGYVCQGDPISKVLKNYKIIWIPSIPCGRTLYIQVRTGRSHLLRGILHCAAAQCCGDGTLATRQYLLLDRHNKIASQQDPLEKMQGID